MLLGLGLSSRAQFSAFAVLDSSPPLGMRLSALQLWKFAGAELLFACLFSLPVYCAYRLRTRPPSARFSLTMAGCLVLGAAVLGFITGLEAHLIETLNVPFRYEMLLGFSDSFPVSELLPQLTLGDAAYVFGPPVLFVTLLSLSGRAAAFRERAVVGSALFCLVLSVALLGVRSPDQRAQALSVPAAQHVISEVVTGLIAPPPAHFQVPRMYGRAQDDRLALTDPVFGEAAAPSARSCPVGPSAARAKNVVFIIMESVAERRAFDASLAGKLPMPTLAALRNEGLYLASHVSSSNSSHNSLFSIFSGLYPWPKPEPLSMAEDLRFPSLFSLLPADYDTFLVSPGNLKWYFPYAHLKNTGIDELWGRENITLAAPRAHDQSALHELDGVDFFLERLARAKPPFAAAYYSFAPHHPYTNPGAHYDITRGETDLERYYNGLALLDAQIARIVAAVRAKSPAEDTLIVITGDHGEAFGEHPGNSVHGQYSFQENLHTPALLLHPALFEKRELRAATSHVDFLPTVLDALCQPYDPAWLQGRSLLGVEEPRRSYVYAYGNEHALTSLSASRKVTVHNKSGERWAYDLAHDPREMRLLEVENQDPQLVALLQFQRFQTEALLRYKARTESHGPLAGRLPD